MLSFCACTKILKRVLGYKEADSNYLDTGYLFYPYILYYTDDNNYDLRGRPRASENVVQKEIAHNSTGTQYPSFLNQSFTCKTLLPS